MGSLKDANIAQVSCCISYVQICFLSFMKQHILTKNLLIMTEIKYEIVKMKLPNPFWTQSYKTFSNLG